MDSWDIYELFRVERGFRESWVNDTTWRCGNGNLKGFYRHSLVESAYILRKLPICVESSVLIHQGNKEFMRFNVIGDAISDYVQLLESYNEKTNEPLELVAKGLLLAESTSGRMVSLEFPFNGLLAVDVLRAWYPTNR